MSDLPTYDLSPEGVTAALDALPVRSEDIAHRLDELGIKGVEDNDCACPIAVYLAKVLGPDVEYVMVSGEEAYIDAIVTVDGFTSRAILRPALPDGVATFIEDYDAGKYPELIEEGTAA